MCRKKLLHTPLYEKKRSRTSSKNEWMTFWKLICMFRTSIDDRHRLFVMG
jgi:hypothetical protein